MFDDELKKPKGHETGMPIDALSVEELTHRVGLLESEIIRLKMAIAARNATRKAADSAFKL